jgi:hypothetical protein
MSQADAPGRASAAGSYLFKGEHDNGFHHHLADWPDPPVCEPMHQALAEAALSIEISNLLGMFEQS